MAPASFHARIERIQQAQSQTRVAAPKSVREPGAASIAASLRVKRRRSRSPIREHLSSLALGSVMGCLAAVAQIGLNYEGSPWGPGTQWNELAMYPIMAGLALAPVLMLMSVFLASKKPAFALFSLGYLSGLVIPLIL